MFNIANIGKIFTDDKKIYACVGYDFQAQKYLGKELEYSLFVTNGFKILPNYIDILKMKEIRYDDIFEIDNKNIEELRKKLKIKEKFFEKHSNDIKKENLFGKFFDCKRNIEITKRKLKDAPGDRKLMTELSQFLKGMRRLMKRYHRYWGKNYTNIVIELTQNFDTFEEFESIERMIKSYDRRKQNLDYCFNLLSNIQK